MEAIKNADMAAEKLSVRLVESEGEARGRAELNVGLVIMVGVLVAAMAVSACLHIVARFCMKKGRGRNGLEHGGAEQSHVSSIHGSQLLQGPSQGLDQAAIDSLPSFLYKSLKGIKDSNDCAVCLTPFLPDDKLSFLPSCSHAFHFHCISTWVSSHPSCPLCRSIIIPPTPLNSPSPAPSEHSPHSSPPLLSTHKRARSEKIASDKPSKALLVSVQLGRFRYNGGDETTRTQRRAYSLGSYEYVLNANDLQVPLSPLSYSGVYLKKQSHVDDLSAFVTLGFDLEPSSSTIKERLLHKMWPVSEISVPKGRTFSFRLPRQEMKLKAGEQKRRSLSEATGLESVVCVSAMPSTMTSSEAESTGRLPSFRKWALNWLRI